MSQKITLDPVTRIEGHAKITIHLDETGQVEGARSSHELLNKRFLCPV
ncbi:MAG: hypothetical protein QNJ53_06075 [Pleurocapsa sp. MO_192.B19]|nr:hypothetical protein [Pleurocapsa sp. MO_192.B19]